MNRIDPIKNTLTNQNFIALEHLTSAHDELAHSLHFADALRLALVNAEPEMQAALNMVLAGLTGAAEYVAAAESALRASA